MLCSAGTVSNKYPTHFRSNTMHLWEKHFHAFQIQFHTSNSIPCIGLIPSHAFNSIPCIHFHSMLEELSQFHTAASSDPCSAADMHVCDQCARCKVHVLCWNIEELVHTPCNCTSRVQYACAWACQQSCMCSIHAGVHVGDTYKYSDYACKVEQS